MKTEDTIVANPNLHIKIEKIYIPEMPRLAVIAALWLIKETKPGRRRFFGSADADIILCPKGRSVVVSEGGNSISLGFNDAQISHRRTASKLYDIDCTLNRILFELGLMEDPAVRFAMRAIIRDGYAGGSCVPDEIGALVRLMFRSNVHFGTIYQLVGYILESEIQDIRNSISNGLSSDHIDKLNDRPLIDGERGESLIGKYVSKEAARKWSKKITSALAAKDLRLSQAEDTLRNKKHTTWIPFQMDHKVRSLAVVTGTQNPELVQVAGKMGADVTMVVSRSGHVQIMSRTKIFLQKIAAAIRYEEMLEDGIPHNEILVKYLFSTGCISECTSWDLWGNLRGIFNGGECPGLIRPTRLTQERLIEIIVSNGDCVLKNEGDGAKHVSANLSQRKVV